MEKNSCSIITREDKVENDDRNREREKRSCGESDEEWEGSEKGIEKRKAIKRVKG